MTLSGQGGRRAAPRGSDDAGQQRLADAGTDLAGMGRELQADGEHGDQRAQFLRDHAGAVLAEAGEGQQQADLVVLAVGTNPPGVKDCTANRLSTRHSRSGSAMPSIWKIDRVSVSAQEVSQTFGRITWRSSPSGCLARKRGRGLTCDAPGSVSTREILPEACRIFLLFCVILRYPCILDPYVFLCREYLCPFHWICTISVFSLCCRRNPRFPPPRLPSASDFPNRPAGGASNA